MTKRTFVLDSTHRSSAQVDIALRLPQLPRVQSTADLGDDSESPSTRRPPHTTLAYSETGREKRAHSRKGKEGSLREDLYTDAPSATVLCAWRPPAPPRPPCSGSCYINGPSPPCVLSPSHSALDPPPLQHFPASKMAPSFLPSYTRHQTGGTRTLSLPPLLPRCPPALNSSGSGSDSPITLAWIQMTQISNCHCFFILHHIWPLRALDGFLRFSLHLVSPIFPSPGLCLFPKQPLLHHLPPTHGQTEDSGLTFPLVSLRDVFFSHSLDDHYAVAELSNLGLRPITLALAPHSHGHTDEIPSSPFALCPCGMVHCSARHFTMMIQSEKSQIKAGSSSSATHFLSDLAS